MALGIAILELHSIDMSNDLTRLACHSCHVARGHTLRLLEVPTFLISWDCTDLGGLGVAQFPRTCQVCPVPI